MKLNNKKTKKYLKENNKVKVLLQQKLELDFQYTKRKLKINEIFSLVISSLIILLNMTIIALAIWSIVLLSIEIYKNNDTFFNSIIKLSINPKVNQIIIPLLVAIFTILSFVISLSLLIYNAKSKSNFFEQKSQEIQYIILKLNNKEDSDIEEYINLYNKVMKVEFENNKINYKKIFKKVLIEHKSGK